MKRTLEQWQGCNPATMMEGMSKRGVIRTLEEAKADILELHAETALLRAATHAASDYLVGLAINGFAEEHGGIDRMLQDLREAVYKWEMSGSD